MNTAVRSLKFFTKPGCHLCDEGLERVLRVAQRHGLLVEKINIEEAPGLLARHGQRIPVVELDGEEIGWGRISEKGIERAIGRRL